MESYLIFDLVIIIFIFLSAIFSFSRGFSQEILSLVSWLSAFFISYLFSNKFIYITQFIIDNSLISKIVTYFVVFVASLFLLSYLTGKFSSTIKKSTVGMLDRSLGFIFGVARGYVLLCLCFFVINSFYVDKVPKWLEKSKMNYVLMYGSIKVVSLFDKENTSVNMLKNKIKNKSEMLFEKSIDSHIRREKSLNFNDGYKKEDREELEYLIENIE